jgi:hypothetical protein
MTTIIRFVARVIIGLLWLRFVLKLLVVSASGIVATLYTITSYLIKPFQGIFPNLTLPGNFLVETNTLLAIVVFALIEFLLIRILHATSHDDY